MLIHQAKIVWQKTSSLCFGYGVLHGIHSTMLGQIRLFCKIKSNTRKRSCFSLWLKIIWLIVPDILYKNNMSCVLASSYSVDADYTALSK